METQQVVVRSNLQENEKPRFDIDRGRSSTTFPWNYCLTDDFTDIKTTTSPFLFLAVDLPPPPLFQDAVEKNIIPQVSIQSVLAKYDGRSAQVLQ